MPMLPRYTQQTFILQIKTNSMQNSSGKKWENSGKESISYSQK